MASAATEIIDGIEYEVVYLDGDDANNRSIIEENNNNVSGNYRYVLTADWTLPAENGIQFIQNDAAIIFDLNGYTLMTSGWTTTTHSFLCIYCKKFEVADSSLARTGVSRCYLSQSSVNSGSPVFGVFSVEQFIVSGGTHYARMEFRDAKNISLLGGTMKNTFYVFDDYHPTLTVAPWVNATYNQGEDDGELLSSATSPDYFAVSTTPYASGAYNYAYGYTWELSAMELNNLKIPDDKTYYLWGRNADGWYEYLNLRYVDGEWRNA